MHWLYNCFVFIYSGLIRLASLWNSKAKLAIDGREKWLEKFKENVNPNDNWIWMHCSSLGEFEQGRPVFEALKKKYHSHKFALSFFSPSGFEIRKNYELADYIFYLPFDSPKNAKKLADFFKPKLWVLVKYDYWYNHLIEQKKNQTKIVVISAIFRENQVYFLSYSKWFSKQLKNTIAHFFVQDDNSKKLLENINIQNVTISGDTRFDRVKKIATSDNSLDWLEKFKQNSRLFVVGSSWEKDEDLWVEFANNNLPENWKIVMVPHEIKAEKIEKLKSRFLQKTILFSEQNFDENAHILIVDVIGFLSKIYSYADVAYVGGGFSSSGVHNTLEAAVFNIPVVIGTNYSKFNEVKELEKEKLLFSVKSYSEFSEVLNKLFEKQGKNEDFRQKSITYFQNKKSATGIILNKINL